MTKKHECKRDFRDLYPKERLIELLKDTIKEIRTSEFLNNSACGYSADSELFAIKIELKGWYKTLNS